MRRSLARSNAHFARAVRRLPLGVASNFRYWGEDATLYIARGKGARVWDLDGNEYIDYRLGYGPAILGYGDERVDAAAREGMAVGSVFALSTPRELAVAERIAGMVPAAERVRFANSGTEAVMAALRLARAHTGRDGYVVIEGGYHGVFDAVLWLSDVEGWDGNGAPALVPYGEGVPRAIRQMIWSVPLNDAGALEAVLARHGGEIGALLIEPILGNCCAIAAAPDYLADVRALCDRFGVVMIVDEVKTGFRVARGGAQALYGVAADLCTFAKAMGNGYPIAALAGREAIMRRIGDGVVHGGTYTAHAMALAAAERTLEILDETATLADIAAHGTRLREGIGAILGARGIAHAFTGHPALSGLFFAETAPTNYRDWKRSDHTFYDALAAELIDLGVLVEPDSREPWFLSAAHDEATLGATLERFETAVDAAREKLRAA